MARRATVSGVSGGSSFSSSSVMAGLVRFSRSSPGLVMVAGYTTCTRTGVSGYRCASIASVSASPRSAHLDGVYGPYPAMANSASTDAVKMMCLGSGRPVLLPVLLPVVVVVLLVVVGVVVVEVVFVYPGLGQLLVDSVAKRDIPVVQACSLIFAATYILLNTSADVLSIASNPRLMHPKG